MALPEVVTKCTVFLCSKGVDDYQPEGTAFLVSMQTPEPEFFANYLVTARHVVDDIPKKGLDKYIYARLNPREGPRYEPISSLRESWVTHPTDGRLDVAVLPFDVPASWVPRGYDAMALADTMALTPEAIKDEQIGVGDEVFTTGLFVKHTGRKRDVPIMRAGNIAMMPQEVRFDAGDMEVFLVEARSIGGLSGSPVFVRASNFPQGIGIQTLLRRPPIYWLGVHQGSWHSALNQDVPFGAIAEGAALEEPRGVHMGVGIVVPAWKAMEVVNHPDLVGHREYLAREYLARNRPTPD